jgi:PKD domain
MAWTGAPSRPAAALLLAVACGGAPPMGAEPLAVGRADREEGPVPLRVCFDATASRDAGAGPLSLTWDFGDGAARAAGPTACHAYAEPGSYAASVEAIDLAGRRALSVVIVTATGPGEDLPLGP